MLSTGFRLLRAASLRVKITVAFVVLVVGGTAVCTYLGSRIITGAVVDEAQRRVQTGLGTARMMVQFRLDRVRRSVIRVTESEKLPAAIREGNPGHLAALLHDLRHGNYLDFLGVATEAGALVTSAGGQSRLGATERPLAALLAAARAGETVSSIEVLPRSSFEREGRALAERARLRIVRVPRAKPLGEEVLDRGLVLFAARPVATSSGALGVIYGGVLLNRDQEIVDEIRQGVFGGQVFRGTKLGTATIFLGDVRVSTNVLSGGQRALGTRASAEVAHAVLEEGVPWHGRAFVVSDWFVTAYEPLRDHAHRIVGMLYVGLQEEPYLAIRTDMMLTFLVVAGLGVLIVLGLTYAIARTMIRPLEEMVLATKKIAAGDLDTSVQVSSGDEVGKLAESFNAMSASLKQARAELEEWGRKLEERVRERTEELVRVQSRMAQAEKLASLGRMAAGVAHEINNPMGGILTFAKLGLDDLPAEHPQRSNFEIIVKQTLRCRDIVRGLLEFARKSESKAGLTDMNTVVERTLELMQRQASFQNIKTTWTPRPNLPPVLVDAGRLEEVVLNMVINAADAMEEQGELRLQTDVEADGKNVLLRVADTGKGIPREVLPLIFEPFFTTKEVGKGTGLGLAIVHGIVTRAGGQIEVETSEMGTTFTVTLPVGSGEEQADEEEGR